jgi:soluble lytic murein transglycosylase-like protein
MGLVQALNQLWQPKPSPGLAELVRLNAEKFKLDPKLVACIILQESAADEDAYRFEDDFYERLLKKKQRKDLVGYVPLFPPTLISEKRARSASYGVMQVMGETARWMGFRERWLTKLARSEFNIEVGCRYLRYLFDKAEKMEADAKAQLDWVLTKWNGSASYPPLIHERMANEQWRQILNGA